MRKNNRKPQEPKRPVRQVARALPDLLRKQEKSSKKSPKLMKPVPVRPSPNHMPPEDSADCGIKQMEISPRYSCEDELLKDIQSIFSSNLALQLITAINSGNIQALQGLLDQKPDLEVVDEAGRTPLICAIFSGNTDMVKLLIAAGAQIKAGKTNPAQVAQLLGNEEIINILYFHKVSVHKYDGECNTIRDGRLCECAQCADKLREENIHSTNDRVEFDKRELALSPRQIEQKIKEKSKRKDLSRAAARQRQLELRARSLEVVDEQQHPTPEQLAEFLMKFDEEAQKTAQQPQPPSITDVFDSMLAKKNWML